MIKRHVLLPLFYRWKRRIVANLMILRTSRKVAGPQIDEVRSRAWRQCGGHTHILAGRLNVSSGFNPLAVARVPLVRREEDHGTVDRLRARELYLDPIT